MVYIFGRNDQKGIEWLAQFQVGFYSLVSDFANNKKTAFEPNTKSNI